MKRKFWFRSRVCIGQSIETPPDGKLRTAAVIRPTSSTTKPSLITSADRCRRNRNGMYPSTKNPARKPR